ncbi:hypothetical protein [Thermoflexus sp.]|uniref:hypothetical protein n=1 Tax=Thermoflexus sp. TaxID=1969742 RepID=UPI0035E45859
MIPGPDRIIACPHCGFLAKQHTLLSGNTIGAILWSDGKMEAPMLPEFPAVTKCRGCKRFYWVDEAEVKGEIKPFDDKSERVPEEWKRAEPIEHLTIDEYIEALDAGVGTDAEKERYLRVHFWWAVNDIVRRNPNAKIPAKYIEKLRENLRNLFVLLDERNPNDGIMKAEIAREMGDFTQAIRLLEDISTNLRWVADTIIELSKQKNSSVMQLRPD